MFSLNDVGFLGALSAYDPDAQTYIWSVESADGQSLETGVRDAINAFVVGCKADGIWTAIKASCILAGARTLAGALVPLVGTGPTNAGALFVGGDYDRETGLVGSSTKHLNSNRNNNADPQDSNHNSVYISTIGTGFAMGLEAVTGTGNNAMGATAIRNRTNTNTSYSIATGLVGHSRSASSSFTYRVSGSNASANVTSQTPQNSNVTILRAATTYATHRIAFYSIGESLDLALLDARVTTLINAFAAAIP
jgi:hypothetical protein